MITKERLVRFGKIFLMPLLFLFACQVDKEETISKSTNKHKGTEIVPTDSVTLIPEKGLVFYKNQPFTGTSVSQYPNGNKSISIEYFDGKKDGLYKKWFGDGTLSFEANYQNGKQDGTSKTWWRSGKLRSESNYENGVVQGVQKQWYKSGAIFKEQNIVNGKEEGIQRAWRENGKIYNNYEAKNGRIFGLKRSTLCYELEDEKLVDKDK